MATKTGKKKTGIAADPNQALIQLNLVDGTRSPIADDQDVLIRITDGFQRLWFNHDKQGPRQFFSVPFFDNLEDNYTVLVSSDHCVDAGLTPIKVSPDLISLVDLMILPDAADFRFMDWNVMEQVNPDVFAFLNLGLSRKDAKANYTQLQGDKPATLASLLNLATAMQSIHLNIGTALDYFKEIEWDDSLAQDRFFAYADQDLIVQVKTAAAAPQPTFQAEVSPGMFHPGATLSYKEIRLGEANVQLTFHGNDTKMIGTTTCVKVEPDIDYFRDPAAHALLEVIPNSVAHGLTDPKKVYILRWMAGRHAGLPEFNPPYTLAA